jgi:hypothetical protein
MVTQTHQKQASDDVKRGQKSQHSIAGNSMTQIAIETSIHKGQIHHQL